MNIYRIERSEDHSCRHPDFCTCPYYVGAIVLAPDEYSAKRIHPVGGVCWSNNVWVYAHDNSIYNDYNEWVHPDKVTVILLGTALDSMTKAYVILADYEDGCI